jgi:8-oxo-dGTP diphosphatase
VKVVLRDGSGRCLLLRRSMRSQRNAGTWDLPGGKVERGESLDEALAREVLEETGLHASIDGVAGVEQSERENVRILYLILEGRADDGAVVLSDEHDDFAWVEPRELATMEFASGLRTFAREYGSRGEL